MSLSNNTTQLRRLQGILANKAADSGVGITLPILTNPGDADKLLEGYELIGQDGQIVTGEIESRDEDDVAIQGKDITIPAGYYPLQVDKSVLSAEQATPNITVDDNGLITAQATQSEGYVEAGSKSATKQLPTKGATTITPTTVEQVAVEAGTYCTGDVKVAAVPGGSTELKTCSAQIEVYVYTDVAITYTTVSNGVEEPKVEVATYQLDIPNLKKGSTITIYAPGNSTDNVTGGAVLLGNSNDYACLVYHVTGDCAININ